MPLNDDQEGQRKLAAILAADVAGYSKLMADDERATIASLKVARAVFRERIEAHAGRLIDTTGDSVLAEFRSPVEAVECAVEIQRQLKTINAPAPDHRQMHFRIGVNLGDVIEEADGTIYGDGVNVAARLEGLAEPGGIMLGLFVELQSPGLVFPGVVGAICLLLAFYAFHLLPINYAGLALIVLGIALIMTEAFMPSFGVVGIGGLAAFVIGSVLLIDTDVPGYGVSWELIGSFSFIVGASKLLLVTFFVRIRRRPVVAGPEHMIGDSGKVIDWDGGAGHVRTQGEIWQARANAPLDAGQSVRVTALDGLKIIVEPAAPAAPTAPAAAGAPDGSKRE